MKRLVVGLLGAAIGVPLGLTIALFTGWRPAVAVLSITFGVLAIWAEGRRQDEQPPDGSNHPTTLFPRSFDDK